MNPGDRPGRSVLIDTNLLVLYIVGTVNPRRIEIFKRTRAYDLEAFDLLLKVMSNFTRICTVAQVMTEVSNLTDLDGREGREARRVLAETIAIAEEPHVPSVEASKSRSYGSLGLTDAAIAVVARQQNCLVLTDDLDLYVSLMNDGLPAVKFSHLREANWKRSG